MIETILVKSAVIGGTILSMVVFALGYYIGGIEGAKNARYNHGIRYGRRLEREGNEDDTAVFQRAMIIDNTKKILHQIRKVKNKK